MHLMNEREPDYASCSVDELLDVERRIDRDAYPERWQRLQQELARRRHEGEPGNRPATSRLSFGGYVSLHLLVCPLVAGICALLLDSDGEGAGSLPMIAVPAVGALALCSMATYHAYRDAQEPDRLLLISLFTTAIGAPAVVLSLGALASWLGGVLS